MKTLLTAVALVAVVASSAFAASAPSDVVTVAGKYVGQDPDLNIRSALIRDAHVSEY